MDFLDYKVWLKFFMWATKLVCILNPNSYPKLSVFVYRFLYAHDAGLCLFLYILVLYFCVVY